MATYNVFWEWPTSLANSHRPCRRLHTTQPLRDLLQKGNQWVWGPSQRTAFGAVKEELSKTPVLALYDPLRPPTVSENASSFGLGAVLLQAIDGVNRPVAYASRAMTPTEQRKLTRGFGDDLVGRRPGRAMTWSGDDLVGRRPGRATTWSGDDLVGRRPGRATTWSGDDLVGRRLGRATTWSGDDLVGRRLGRATTWSGDDLVGRAIQRLPVQHVV